ncbi:MAG TPA: TonB-dependent receptor [Rhodanobacteraceae bacterium]|nr:TonB-dependent receptor [Rhodanobacteraceae bacterium]
MPSIRSQSHPRRKAVFAVAIAAFGCPVHATAFAEDAAAKKLQAASPAGHASDASGQAPAPPQADAPLTLDTVQVNARLDRARNALSPDTGTSRTVFDRKAIRQLPQGEDTPLNQVLLQAPGVVQDSFGQLHVRGDHANLQYRIDGVIIPESISGFGQALDTRAIQSLTFLTGALPAQYGYRTAGVVEIDTKSGAQLGDGGNVNLYGGSFGTFNPGFEVHGNQGRWSYYLTANFLESDIGIQNPTPARNAIHDRTDQFKSFGYLSYLIDDNTRAGFYFGTANNRFQIPNNPGQSPQFAYGDISDFDSSKLDENQREETRFGVFNLQGHVTKLNTDYRIALGQRFSSVAFRPDLIGDLMFNGVASTVHRGDRATTLQADFSTPLGESHLLRYGFYAENEGAASNNDSWVFPADIEGAQTSTTPFRVVDNHFQRAHTLGAYVQDQWQVADDLMVNYGLRADRYSAWLKEGQLSPRVGLVWNATATTTVHAGYARYFTPPDTELIAPEDIALYAGTTNQLPNDLTGPVKAERSNYYDVGVSQKLGPHLTVGLDSYYRQVNYLQDEGQFGAALVYSPFNYARGRARGIELSANYDSGPLSAYFNLAQSRAVGKGIISGQYNFDEDELDYIDAHWVHLDHDQKLVASGGMSYALDAATRVGADFLYGSGLRRDFANTASLPSYFQLNLSLERGFRLPGFRKLDARLVLINALDRVYELRDGSGIGVGAPQYGPRRGMYLGLSKDF